MNLAELKALALEATPGQWVSGVIPMCEISQGTLCCCAGKSFDSNVSHAVTGPADDEQSAKDAAYIAAACPAAILELLAEIDRLSARG